MKRRLPDLLFDWEEPRNMNTVKVLKTDVIEALRRNRDEHQATYTEANTTYRQKVVNALRDRADEIDAGGEIKTYFELPKPEDHTDDYDEALETLKWEQREELDLPRHTEFAQWVLNKWPWEHSFAANTTSYTAGGGGAYPR